MSDHSEPYLKSSTSSKSKHEASESSSTPSLYSVTQEVKKRALSAYRKKLPPLELDPRTKAKTEVIWARAASKTHLLDQAEKPSTVADFLAEEADLGEVPDILGSEVKSKDGVEKLGKFDNPKDLAASSLPSSQTGTGRIEEEKEENSDEEEPESHLLMEESSGSNNNQSGSSSRGNVVNTAVIIWLFDQLV